jgi:DNA-directed RNA polymerase subunit RPC12/RpoP
MPNLRCLHCGHEQTVEDSTGAACARCGTEFLQPPKSTTPFVIGITVLEILGILLLFAVLGLYVYVRLAR